MDHIRHHRAREEVKTERDRLVARSNRMFDPEKMQKLMPSDGKDKARASALAFSVAAVSSIAYIVMIVFWFRVYHSSFPGTLMMLAALLFIGGVMCVCSQEGIAGRRRPWLFTVGIFWIISTIVGTVVGFVIYFNSLVYFWRYAEMRPYTNVAAAESPDAFLDGSMFLWTEDTRLDAMRAVGFKSRWNGRVYCVAPIVDNSMTNAQDINFWAVGEGCCEPRAEFHCDDAESMTTRTALALLEPKDVVRDYMRWAVRDSILPKYENALRLQEATYFTKASPTPRFVRWVSDPVAAKDQYYTDARVAAIWSSIVYFVLCLLAAWAASWQIVKKSAKPEVFR